MTEKLDSFVTNNGIDWRLIKSVPLETPVMVAGRGFVSFGRYVAGMGFTPADGYETPRDRAILLWAHPSTLKEIKFYSDQ